MNAELREILLWVFKVSIVVMALPALVPVLIWVERKFVADYQVRIGPNRVGPFGILQPIADGIKLLLKEDYTPAQANAFLHALAPLLALVPALMVFAAIPFGPEPFHIAADINVGLLYILALTSLNVYALVLAGWASNNKYSLLGGLRSSAQMISYELAMGLALVSVVMVSSHTNMNEIVIAQGATSWNAFKFPLMFAFLIYFVAGVAETNRLPFDLPEAETELVAGFHTEYSSMKFALFFMAEYINMFAVSALATSVFFGGWNGPFVDQVPVLGVFWFFAKSFVFIYLYMWARGSWPRVRYDQLMRLGWTVMLPAAVGLVIVNAFVLALEPGPVVSMSINGIGIVLFIAFFVAGSLWKPSGSQISTVRLTGGKTPVG